MNSNSNKEGVNGFSLHSSMLNGAVVYFDELSAVLPQDLESSATLSGLHFGEFELVSGASSSLVQFQLFLSERFMRQHER
jgi:hypothetical protein